MIRVRVQGVMVVVTALDRVKRGADVVQSRPVLPLPEVAVSGFAVSFVRRCVAVIRFTAMAVALRVVVVMTVTTARGSAGGLLAGAGAFGLA